MKTFELRTPLFQEVMDDEMPAAPGGGPTSGEVPQAEFGGEIDESAYAKVPEMGEALPIGTYHFRCDSYKEGWGDPPKPGDKDFAFGPQPYFQIKFVAQQEPIVGRAFMDFVPWVSDSVAKAAGQGDPVAQEVVNDRIWKAKSIASAAGYKPAPGSKFNVKTFLSSNPELKISLGLQERKQKDKTGKYVGTGVQGNRVNAYLPLFDAARK